jgi:hypothetical protein
MHRPSFLAASLALSLLTFPAAVGLAAPAPAAARADQLPTGSRALLQRALDSAPPAFVENRGQTDGRVIYYVSGRDKTLYFTEEGVTLGLAGAAGEGRGSWVMKLDYLGARRVRPVGGDPTGATVSHFRGKPSSWLSGIPTFRKIVYRDLWPGIDLEFSGAESHLKYQFVVRPGADPSRIRLAWRGALDLRNLADGRLEVAAPGVSFTDGIPLAWQEKEGQRKEVRMAYVVAPVDGARTDAGRSFSFEVGDYDRALPLVLDPAVQVYTGFLGGSGNDEVNAVAVHTDGSLYVAGRALSSQNTFPVDVGPDLSWNGSEDAFVARIAADGSGLEWCGFIGGAGSDQAYDVAVDGDGNAYLAGSTSSDQASFPVLVGPDLTANGYGQDAFVARVKADGTALDWCGFIGGSDNDAARGIAVDSSGNAYVTGNTGSNQTSFPVAVGPDLTHNGNGTMDAFVAKVAADGRALDWCGYIGGSGNDFAYDIARTSTGSLYVVGYTLSTESSFPVLVGPDLTHGGGNMDAFVARVRGDGAALETCGYVGGSGYDMIYGVAVDGQDRALVAGETASAEDTFPVAVGPDLTFNGSSDAFVARLAADGTALEFCGYLGGDGYETATGVAVDGQGRAVVVGDTSSDEASFPVRSGPDGTYGGGGDGFAALVRADGSGLVWCGYLGGSGHDKCYGVAVDGVGDVYLGGYATSTETTFPVLVGPDLTANGGYDGFVSKLTWENDPPVLDPIEGRSVVEGKLLRFIVTASDPDSDGPPLLEVEGLPDGASFDPADGSFSWRPHYAQSGSYDILFRAVDGGAPPLSDEETVTITVSNPANPVIFTDPFSVPGSLGADPDWTLVSGTWTVGHTGTLQSGSGVNATALVARFDPVDWPFTAGVVTSRIMMTTTFANYANAAIVFARQDATHYRYVRLRRDRVIIGQVGDFGGDVAGIKRSRPATLPTGRWTSLAVKIHPGGLVELWKGTTRLAAFSFLQAVPGGTGIATLKARSLFDFFTVRDDGDLLTP